MAESTDEDWPLGRCGSRSPHDEGPSNLHTQQKKKEEEEEKEKKEKDKEKENEKEKKKKKEFV